MLRFPHKLAVAHLRTAVLHENDVYGHALCTILDILELHDMAMRNVAVVRTLREEGNCDISSSEHVMNLGFIALQITSLHLTQWVNGDITISVSLSKFFFVSKRDPLPLRKITVRNHGGRDETKPSLSRHPVQDAPTLQPGTRLHSSQTIQRCDMNAKQKELEETGGSTFARSELHHTSPQYSRTTALRPFQFQHWHVGGWHIKICVWSVLFQPPEIVTKQGNFVQVECSARTPWRAWGCVRRPCHPPLP